MAKLFVREIGTEALILLFAPLEANAKLVSALTPVEVHSAIRRRQRAGDLSTSAGNNAVLLLAAELQQMQVIDISQSVLNVAAEMIDRQVLRALDAIQLATAVLRNRALDGADTLQFISSDEQLLLAASAEGLSVWNPSTFQGRRRS